MPSNSNDTWSGKNHSAKETLLPPTPRSPCMLGEQNPSMEVTPSVCASVRWSSIHRAASS